jgi:biotin carboxyl carrier protein
MAPMSSNGPNRGAGRVGRRTARPPSGTALAPVEAAARTPDPRGVRVTLVAGGTLDGVPPIVLEPAAVLVGPAARSAGLGPLGGVAPLQNPLLTHDPDEGLTIDGAPLAATFDRLDAERGILRPEPGSAARRTLVLEPGGTPGATEGVVRREVVVDGWRFEVEVEPAARAALRERARRGREEAGRSGPTDVRAIIPGVVVSVSVAAGDLVEAGQQLLVVEAMKMQNELRAPREGSIDRVAVGTGATIEVGDLLLVIS